MATEAQIKVLKFIRKETSESGICPTLREIGDAMNFSHQAARKMIIRLEREGFVQRRPDKARAIKVLKIPREVAKAA